MKRDKYIVLWNKKIKRYVLTKDDDVSTYERVIAIYDSISDALDDYPDALPLVKKERRKHHEISYATSVFTNSRS